MSSLTSTSPPRLSETPTAVLPFVTVIMPVRNEEPFIARALDSLLTQRYPPDSFEVLVIDGRSEDRTREVVGEYSRRHENVRLLDNPQRLSSAARNVGVRHARGEFLIVVDGHCELADPNYLANLADAFLRTGADCLGRPQPLEVSDGTLLQQAIAAARSSPLGHHPDSFIYSQGEQFVPAQSVAVAYRRSVFEQVGLFDESFDACEDGELNYRIDQAGLRCLFTDRIQLPYVPRNSLPGLFRQLVRYGRGRVRLVRKHPGTFSLASFVPALFVLGCLAGPCVLWLSRWLAAIYFSTLALYGSIVLAVSIVTAIRQRKLLLLPWLMVVFPVVHVASGVGALLEAIRGKAFSETATL